jgi:hypothetical protein
MADTNVKIILSAEDKTKAALSSAQGGLNNFTGTIKKFAAAAGVAFAAKQIFDFGVSAVKAFSESEAAMARVDATLKSMGDSALKNRDAILKASDAAVKLGFDDEDTAESITKLYRATGNFNEALRLNTLAMDIARGKDIELSEANRIVTLALAGSTKELRNMGIAVDENMTSTQALLAMETAYAGQSAAAAETTKVKMEALSISWNNFKESVGASLSEGLKPFLDKLIQIVSDPRFVKFFTDLVALGVKVLDGAIKGFLKTLDLMTDGWLAVFNIANKVKEAFDAVVTSITNAYNSVSKFVGKVGSGFMGGVSSGISAVRNFIGLASGGPASPSGSYMVGEQGPELFRPKSAGDIIPAYALSRGGNTTIVNITGNTLMDDLAAEKIGNLIIDRLKLTAQFT